MTRTACVLIGLLALVPAGSPVDVDAVVFLRAFRAGAADQYRTSAYAAAA